MFIDFVYINILLDVLFNNEVSFNYKTQTILTNFIKICNFLSLGW